MLSIQRIKKKHNRENYNFRHTPVCVITSPCASGPWPDPGASVARSPCELCCRPAIVVSAFRSPVPSLCPLLGSAFLLGEDELVHKIIKP